jgi:hypothetical protein
MRKKAFKPPNGIQRITLTPIPNIMWVFWFMQEEIGEETE